MAKAGKATKKFQKNHLKKTLDHRRAEQQHHKKVLGKNKKVDAYTGVKPTNSEARTNSRTPEEVFDEDVEEFLKSDVVADLDKKKKPKSQREKADSHKKELDDLMEKDPEFFKYLAQNDKALLDFDPEEFDDEDDNEQDDDDDDDEDNNTKDNNNNNKSTKQKKQPSQTAVSSKDVAQWKQELAAHNTTVLKTVCQAFHSAVVAAEEGEEAANSCKYVVTDPKAFSDLVLLALSAVPGQFTHHIPLKKAAKGKTATVVKDDKHLKALSGAIKHFFTGLNNLLKSGRQSKSTISMILVAADETLPYLQSYRALIKDFIKNVCRVWAESTEDEVQLAAFSFLKGAAELFPNSLLEPILKNSYSEFVKVSRRTTIHTMPSINLLKNGTAALYTIAPSVSYQLSFQFIRQLAVHLRNSIINKTPESYKAVYNWQYVHSLDLWVRVLCANAVVATETGTTQQNPMKELIHPLVQVTLGAMRLIPTPQFFPLRFFLIRSLLQLSQHTGVYIPLVPALSEILISSAITKPGKASTQKPLDFDHNIKAPKTLLGTRVYQDGICDQFVELLAEFYVLHCKSVAFPELAIPTVITLKRFSKRTKNVKFSKQIQRVLEKLDQNSKYIEQHRSKVTFGPLDKEQVDAFLKDVAWETTPLGAYVVTHRQVREEKLKLLRESLADDNEDKDEFGLGEDVEEDEAQSSSGSSSEDEDEPELELNQEEDEDEDEMEIDDE